MRKNGLLITFTDNRYFIPPPPLQPRSNRSSEGMTSSTGSRSGSDGYASTVRHVLLHKSSGEEGFGFVISSSLAKNANKSHADGHGKAQGQYIGKLCFVEISGWPN